ncbi:NmrA-like family protein [Caulifigura coniformis]|uniref:NmrA-like family protein n=1 Tax=Caulifigura coniformis TaxID=2527983 RepID=A0A517SE24_9PLAN|nr:SDR family oxidoreductase [Caulifigura coniformis]QDT54379.1 NmrA-like family protein [Caulifigura coniformis]
MKIVVIGGSGLIGSRLVKRLQKAGHEVLAASPRSGVNAVTGEGLADALHGASVVVDVSNAPSWEEQAVREFFEKSTGNLLTAEGAAGVKHHVVLSVVGAERLVDSGYMKAKVAQESLIKASPIPYTILRATQFMEFVQGIAESFAVGETIRVPTAGIQPVAADDVAAMLADIAVEQPVNGTLELGGPQPFAMDDLVRQYFQSVGLARNVVTDDESRYFGERLQQKSLLPEANARLGKITFKKWVEQNAAVGV